MSDMDPQRYYDEFSEGEWERLTANPVTRLEFENTIAYLDHQLPDTGRVLDAGGGSGRYSIWLADNGYEVVHCDLSPEQVCIAREKVAEHDHTERVTTIEADIRRLPFETGEFDAVCCLGGPLSHILDPDGRARAMRELRRVGDGAPTFVSVIGRLAAARYGMKHGGSPGVFTRVVQTGDYTQALLDEHDAGDGWAECHFFRSAELEADLAAAGFGVTTLVGLEGPATHLGPTLEDATEATIEGVSQVVRSLREDPAVVDCSEHILAVCRG